MKLEHMQELLALKHYENYTLAAKEMFITQSALSRHINALEKELGTTLINRNTHQVRFTEEGMEACGTFEEMLKLYNGYITRLRERQTGAEGLLRIGILYYSSQQSWRSALPAFHKKYPNIKIQTFTRQPHEIYQALLDNEIDAGVLSVADYPDKDLLGFQSFARSGAIAMVPLQHPLSSRKTLTQKDLAHEQIVLLREDLCTTRAIMEALSRCHFIPERTIYSSNIDTMPFTLIETNSIHINSSSLLLPGFEAEIRRIPIVWPELYFTKALAYRTDNHNPALSLFLDMEKSI